MFKPYLVSVCSFLILATSAHSDSTTKLSVSVRLKSAPNTSTVKTPILFRQAGTTNGELSLVNADGTASSVSKQYYSQIFAYDVPGLSPGLTDLVALNNNQVSVFTNSGGNYRSAGSPFNLSSLTGVISQGIVLNNFFGVQNKTLALFDSGSYDKTFTGSSVYYASKGAKVYFMTGSNASSVTSMSLPGNPLKVITADFNQDGFDDMAILTERAVLSGSSTVFDRYIQLYYGGKKIVAVTIPLNITDQENLDIVAADVNQDGSQDIALLIAEGGLQGREDIFWNRKGSFAAKDFSTIRAFMTSTFCTQIEHFLPQPFWGDYNFPSIPVRCPSGKSGIDTIAAAFIDNSGKVVKGGGLFGSDLQLFYFNQLTLSSNTNLLEVGAVDFNADNISDPYIIGDNGRGAQIDMHLSKGSGEKLVSYSIASETLGADYGQPKQVDPFAISGATIRGASKTLTTDDMGKASKKVDKGTVTLSLSHPNFKGAPATQKVSLNNSVVEFRVQ